MDCLADMLGVKKIPQTGLLQSSGGVCVCVCCQSEELCPVHRGVYMLNSHYIVELWCSLSQMYTPASTRTLTPCSLPSRCGAICETNTTKGEDCLLFVASYRET